MDEKRDLTSLAREQEELERKVLEGLDAPAREMSAKEWSKLRETLRQKADSRGKAR